MQWNDRVYGDLTIEDPRILALIACPTFQRLKGIKQAGPSAFAFPFKTVTRYEHSLGVFHLLRMLGADLKEQVAGLLHDVSHTAFSHAVDFVISTEEQDHHESLKPIFLEKPDIVEALQAFSFEPADFLDDSLYPLLERPLPALCADRLDYFLRDGLACGGVSEAEAARILDNITVEDATLVFRDRQVAEEAVALFAAMNRDWWASETESYIYNEFADALREAFRLGQLQRTDLLEDDNFVLLKLRTSGSPLILEKLDRIKQFQPDRLAGFEPKVTPKVRWIVPTVLGKTPAGSTAESL